MFSANETARQFYSVHLDYAVRFMALPLFAYALGAIIGYDSNDTSAISADARVCESDSADDEERLAA